MKKLASPLIVLLFAISLAFPASAEERGTPDEAVALAKKAAAFLEAHGADKAYAEFNAGTNGWKDRDLYVAVTDMQGNVKAHGAKKGLVGRNLTGLKDPDGVKIVEKMIQVARDSGTGWVEYRWPNPVTKKLEQKASYVIRTGDVMVMVGAYKG